MINDSDRELLALAAALNVSPEWLKSGKGEKRQAAPQDPTTARIYRMVPLLTQEDRERLSVLLATVVDSGLSLSAFMDWLQERYAPIPSPEPDHLSPAGGADSATRPAKRSDRTSPAAPNLPRLL